MNLAGHVTGFNKLHPISMDGTRIYIVFCSVELYFEARKIIQKKKSIILRVQSSDLQL